MLLSLGIFTTLTVPICVIPTCLPSSTSACAAHGINLSERRSRFAFKSLSPKAVLTCAASWLTEAQELCGKGPQQMTAALPRISCATPATFGPQ